MSMNDCNAVYDSLSHASRASFLGEGAFWGRMRPMALSSRELAGRRPDCGSPFQDTLSNSISTEVKRRNSLLPVPKIPLYLAPDNVIIEKRTSGRC